MIFILELQQLTAYSNFPISLISKDLMLDSNNEPIHITKREINDKF